MSESNNMSVFFDAKSENERLARMLVAAFVVDLNPSMDILEDVRTAVSEAVTNAVVHGYEGMEPGKVEMICRRQDRKLTIVVRDKGVGMENVAEAMKPFYTSKPRMERSGMGFTFMETFMDQIQVSSSPGKGTEVLMEKYIPRQANAEENE